MTYGDPPICWVCRGYYCRCPSIRSVPFGMTNGGWLCPKCQRGNAPWLATCPCHKEST